MLLLAPGHEAEVEAELRQAIDIAVAQGSRALALRSVDSLVRLLEGQGRADEAREGRAAWLATS